MTTTDAPVQHDGPPIWIDARGVICLRASALGMCTRAAVARFQGYDAMLPPEKMQQRYDDGHLHERSTLDRMGDKEDVRCESYPETTVLVILPGKLEIHGHVDGVIREKITKEIYAVAEAKAFSASMFKQYMAKGGPGELYGYGMQAVVYMLSLGVDTILYGVKNKDSGDVDARWFDLSDSSLPTKADVIKRAMQFYSAVKGPEQMSIGTMECDRVMFPCPVFYLHEETVKPDVEDTVLRDLLAKYKKAQKQEVAAKAVKDEVGLEIADRMKVVGEDALTVLGWSVTAKVGNSSSVDWAMIESLTGMKKAQFTTLKPNSKATVTVTEPKDWAPGQGELM